VEVELSAGVVLIVIVSKPGIQKFSHFLDACLHSQQAVFEQLVLFGPYLDLNVVFQLLLTGRLFDVLEAALEHIALGLVRFESKRVLREESVGFAHVKFDLFEFVLDLLFQLEHVRLELIHTVGRDGVDA